jgi:hypothetical protein
LLSTIHVGTSQGEPLPQLGSRTRLSLCATKRPLSPSHCWFTAIALPRQRTGDES